MPLPTHREQLAAAVRRAMLEPETRLEAALAEIPDENLAAEIGAPRCCIWKLRLATYPRSDRWADQVAQLAALIHAEPARLGALLRRVRVR